MGDISISSIDELREVVESKGQDIDLRIPHGIKYSEEAYSFFVSLLKENRLKSIDYGSSLLFGAEEVDISMARVLLSALREGLAENGSLETLGIDLHGENVDFGIIVGVLSGLRENKSLEDFDLDSFSCDYVDEKGLDVLMGLLELKPEFHISDYFIREVNLHDCHVGGNKIEKIIEMLESGVRINKLDLSGNDIGPELAKKLGSAIRANGFVEELNLADNKIGTKGADDFSSEIMWNDSLKVLNLCNNNIDKGVWYFTAISIHTSLLQIDLDGNEIAKERKPYNYKILDSVLNIKHYLATNVFLEKHFPYLEGSDRERLKKAIEVFLRKKTVEINFEYAGAVAKNVDVVDEQELIDYIVSEYGGMIEVCKALAIISGVTEGSIVTGVKKAKGGFLHALENPRIYRGQIIPYLADKMFNIYQAIADRFFDRRHNVEEDSLRRKLLEGEREAKRESLVYLVYSYASRLAANMEGGLGFHVDDEMARMDIEGDRMILLSSLIESLGGEGLAPIILDDKEDRKRAFMLLIEVMSEKGDWLLESPDGVLSVMRVVVDLFGEELVKSIVEFRQEDINVRRELLKFYLKERKRLEEKIEGLEKYIASLSKDLEEGGDKVKQLEVEIKEKDEDVHKLKGSLEDLIHKIENIEGYVVSREAFLSNFRDSSYFSNKYDLENFTDFLDVIAHELKEEPALDKDVSLKTYFFAHEKFVGKHMDREKKRKEVIGVVYELQWLINEVFSLKSQVPILKKGVSVKV